MCGPPFSYAKEPGRAGAAVGQVVVVDVEAARESETAVEHESGDEGGGGETAFPRALGKRGDCVVQAEPAVVSHAMTRRIEPGHE